MDFTKHSFFHSYATTNSINNSKFNSFQFKQSNIKESTPIRHRKHQKFNPNNTSPIMFGQSNINPHSSPFNNRNSLHSSSALIGTHSKKYGSMLDCKENISINSPSYHFKKKSNKANKIDQTILITSNHRFQTQPHLSKFKLQKFNIQSSQQRFLTTKIRNDYPNIKKYNHLQGISENNHNLNNQNEKFKQNNKITTKQLSGLKLFTHFSKKKRNQIQNQYLQGATQNQSKMSNIIVRNQLKCRNNDGQNARYKVISDEKIDEELCYCSKCTIPLVQQGFILQQIHNLQEDDSQDQIQENIEAQIKLLILQQSNIKNQMEAICNNQLSDLNQINKYYNELIDILSQFQNRDLDKVQHYYQKRQNQLNLRLQNIHKQHYLIQKQSQYTSSIMQQYSQRQINQQQLKFTEYKKIFIDPQAAKSFKQMFQLQFRPSIQHLSISSKIDDNIQKQGHKYNLVENQQYINKHNAMRFSFQKILCNNIGKKKVKARKIAHGLQKVNENAQFQAKNNRSNQPNAFRDLFPQEENNEEFNTDISSPTFKYI